MNLIKDSFFSSKNKTKKRTHAKDYKFRPATNSSSDPLLFTFNEDENDDNGIELGTIDSDDEAQSNEITKTNTGNRENDGEHNRRIVRSRQAKAKKQYFSPAASGGGSLVIVEKPVRPQETIQAFAIRYRVPVSQLKRINNLQNDQDFYALTYCRVPVRRFGLLHESSSSADATTIVNLDQQSTTDTLSTMLPVTHLNQQNHHAFLNAMDKDLASMRAKVEQFTETSPAILIPTESAARSFTRMIQPVKSSAGGDLNCDGADCGCKLWHTLAGILFIALLIPFIYVYFYLKAHPSSSTKFSGHSPK